MKRLNTALGVLALASFAAAVVDQLRRAGGATELAGPSLRRDTLRLQRADRRAAP